MLTIEPRIVGGWMVSYNGTFVANVANYHEALLIRQARESHTHRDRVFTEARTLKSSRRAHYRNRPRGEA